MSVTATAYDVIYLNNGFFLFSAEISTDLSFTFKKFAISSLSHRIKTNLLRHAHEFHRDDWLRSFPIEIDASLRSLNPEYFGNQNEEDLKRMATVTDRQSAFEFMSAVSDSKERLGHLKATKLSGNQYGALELFKMNYGTLIEKNASTLSF